MKNILIDYGKKLIDNGLVTIDFFQYDTLLVKFSTDSELPESYLDRIASFYYDNEETILGELETYYIGVKHAA